jgi:hypothetical protein
VVCCGNPSASILDPYIRRHSTEETGNADTSSGRKVVAVIGIDRYHHWTRRHGIAACGYTSSTPDNEDVSVASSAAPGADVRITAWVAVHCSGGGVITASRVRSRKP